MNDQRMKIRTTGLSWRELDGKIMLLDIASSSYLSISGAGSVIWTALVKGATFDELISAVEAEFDVDHDTATTDVREFVDDLVRRGLLA